MSAQIQRERKLYYDILEKTQRGDLDITEWLTWFLLCLERTLTSAGHTLTSVLNKAHYWSHFSGKTLSDRQKLMISKLLDGFEGKLNTSKWAKITKTSHDTALRDIQNLLDAALIYHINGTSKEKTGTSDEFHQSSG